MRDARGENGPAIYPNTVSPSTAYYDTVTGQRLVMFYLPQIHYPTYRNDLQRLGRMSDRQSVEMALSFDRPYSLAQVQKMLPTNIDRNWYWVNAYSRRDVSFYRSQFGQVGMLSDLYGFNVASPTASPGEEQSFLDALTTGAAQDQWPFRNIYDNIRNGRPNVSTAHVRIIGVIVSGTQQELRQLVGKSYIKASVMGAVANNWG